MKKQFICTTLSLVMLSFACTTDNEQETDATIDIMEQDSTFADTSKLLMEDTALVDYSPEQTFVDEEETTTKEGNSTQR